MAIPIIASPVLFTQHPLSAAFPAMNEDDFGALVEDIRNNGQRQPAVAIGAEILDGWHRVIACEELDIPPKVVQFDGGDPKAFVLSANLFRRQMDAGQRARAVLVVSEWKPLGTNQHGGSVPGADPEKEGGYPVATLLERDRARSASEMAKDANVSVATIKQVKTAERAGLGEAIRDGKISAKSAAELATSDPHLAQQVASGQVPVADAVKRTKALRSPPPPPPEPENDEADQLRAQLAEMVSMVEEQEATLSSLQAVQLGTTGAELEAAKKEVIKLRAYIEIVEGQRNDWMNQCAQLKKEVKTLRRRLGDV